ncbi:serine acetyltransferase [Spirosoma rhododendri]|uniref:Serine acetyltransferase n=1 Tax=Spirosoma rhododendri TaxID=2728024 RepID=A0A7L5DGE1_9BACT|nr:serine acetyltransferase [Spirosoma rhododendri]QJD77229.1 serine acetyltransferase [Spirosoma rhododendri]
MKLVSFIFQDWSANTSNSKGRLLGVLFRLANFGAGSAVARLLLTPYQLLYRLLVEWTLGVELPYNTVVGPGLRIYHGQALVVHKHVRIGRNCILRQSTTIGNAGRGNDCPIIGNNVDIGSNVCIIGPVHIGDNVVIGAGSVVTKSIPTGCTVVGNPARILRRHPAHTDLISSFSPAP